MGLKLLSSQGTGIYDSVTGVWSVGVLPVGDNTSMELTLQVDNAGYFVNTATIIGDLHAFSVRGSLVKAFGVKDASTSSQASYTFTATNPGQTSRGNNLQYDFPPVTPPTNPSKNDKSDSSGPGPEPYHSPPTTQIARDIAGVRDAVSRGELNKSVLPEWNLTTEKKVDDWEALSMLIDVATELLFIQQISSTPGSGEYLQQVKNGMIEAMDSLKMAVSYFTKDPRFAFDLLKKGFKQAGNSFVDDAFMEALSKKTFRMDPNVAQALLEKALCEIFPKQAAQIRTLLTLLGSINFISNPLEIYKAWGDVVYSIFTDGVQGNYDESAKKLEDALEKTFNKPLPFS